MNLVRISTSYSQASSGNSCHDDIAHCRKSNIISLVCKPIELNFRAVRSSCKWVRTLRRFKLDTALRRVDEVLILNIAHEVEFCIESNVCCSKADVARCAVL